MKYLPILLGLVCLVCSQEEDIEFTKNQMMTELTTELSNKGMNTAKAAGLAKSMVDNKDTLEFLLDDLFFLGWSAFKSLDHIEVILETFLPNDVLSTLRDQFNTDEE